MRIKRLAFTLAIFIILAALLAGCSEKPIRSESFAMDTFITITVYDDKDQAAMQECFAILDNYDKQWSAHREDSIITGLNNTGRAVLQGDTAELVRQALSFGSSTEGTFNPVLFPITSLWHIDSRAKEEPLPLENDIASALALSNLNDVKAEDEGGNLSVTLKQGMGFDLGGIAKGFAGDKLKAYLQSKGVKNAIISLGGNVCLLGSKTRSVGLEDPRVNGSLFGKVAVSDVNVITSGDYQRFLEVNGERIHHIIDPKTGTSSHSGLCSVTIIGGNGAQCDALSTAVFILGVERGLSLAKAQGVDAILVTENGKIYMTEGAKKVFTLVNTSYTVQ